MKQDSPEEIYRKKQKELQAWAERIKSSGPHVDMKNIHKRKAEVVLEYKKEPDPDFNGFTPEQMNMMVNFPLEPGCPVQLRNLTREQMFQIPVIRQAVHLLNSLKGQDIKLTSGGYLPFSMVEELFVLGANNDNQYVRGLDKKVESKVEDVNMVRISLEKTGLVRKSSTKLYITEKGERELSDINSLMRTIFVFLFRQFDTGCWDSYNDMKIGNVGRLYSLWLLHYYGKDWRNFQFYEKAYFKAFPTLTLEEYRLSSIYPWRIFKRLFKYLGLCEFKGVCLYPDTRKTPLVDTIFSFQEPALV